MTTELAIPDAYKGDQVLIFYRSDGGYICAEMGKMPFSRLDFELFMSDPMARQTGGSGDYMNHIQGINEALYDKAREFLDFQFSSGPDRTISRIELSDLLRTLPNPSERL